MAGWSNRNQRAYYRKTVSLAGEYTRQSNGEIGEMLVEDLSFQGLRFVTLLPHTLQSGDRLVVRFRLDDAKRTHITKPAEVRFVQERHVGAHFQQSVSMDKDLGFYLMS